MQANRQLSYAAPNRATAERAQFTERLVSRASKSKAASKDDGTSDKVAAHELAQHLISISPFNKRWENQNASVIRLLDKGMLADQRNYGMEFMVLEKAEVDVRAYIYEEKGSARRVRACYVALQSLKGVYDLHMQGLLHRDLKPENMGIIPIVVLFDLGMARMYTQPDSSLRPPRTTVQFRGTPEWASGHALKYREQTRFDDLIAWLYVMVELFDPEPPPKCPLPWSYSRNAKAYRYLKSTYCPARVLLRHCPTPFYAINTYLQSANRLKAPDYGFIADRVMEAIEECKNDKSNVEEGSKYTQTQ